MRENVKVVDTHWPKGKKPGCKYVFYEHMDVGLPVYRQHLTHPVICTERGKPVHLLVAKVGLLQSSHTWYAGMGGWTKRTPTGNRCG